MKQKDKIYTTKAAEGKERVHIFVSVLTEKTQVTLLAHSWGIIDGVQFFDTEDDQHIELHGNFNFVIHTPPQGSTYDINGKIRELRDVERLVEIVN